MGDIVDTEGAHPRATSTRPATTEIEMNHPTATDYPLFELERAS